MSVCTDYSLECLAAWKDGSESYMYGLLTTAEVTIKDDQYRCFVSIARVLAVSRAVAACIMLMIYLFVNKNNKQQAQMLKKKKKHQKHKAHTEVNTCKKMTK